MQIEIESGGDRIRAERIAPGTGTHPGVVVVHDGNGFGEHAIAVANELAQAGYAALAVDLYSRGAPRPGLSNAELLAFLRSVPDHQIVSDLQAAIDFLASDPAVQGLPIGMLGYCWGGACTFLASGHCRGLSAAVSWYGELRTEELNAQHPEHPLDAVAERTCPVLALFAELDAYVPMAYVDELRARAPRNPIDLELVVYPGLHHGFAHRGREHFDQAGHDDGWARVWKLFAREMRTRPRPTPGGGADVDGSGPAPA
jgi:carboxymethylenebutenolidase